MKKILTLIVVGLAIASCSSPEAPKVERTDLVVVKHHKTTSKRIVRRKTAEAEARLGS